MNDLDLIQKDPWLEPFRSTIERRQQKTVAREKELAGESSLQSFASGHLYFGLHKTGDGWIMREWAPNAREIFLVGTFNDWQVRDDFRFAKIEHGNWEFRFKMGTISHKDRYKLLIRWEGGEGERIPAWCNRVVQDPETLACERIGVPIPSILSRIVPATELHSASLPDLVELKCHLCVYLYP